jgi:hypothetical protein
MLAGEREHSTNSRSVVMKSCRFFPTSITTLSGTTVARDAEMTFAETLVLVSILGLAGWALYSMPRATRHDADWHDALRSFAKTKGLIEATVEKAPGEFDSNAHITWKTIKRVWSRNPAVAAPNKGSMVFKGTNNGFPFIMDEVWIRKYWTNLHDAYLRMAVELPGLPVALVAYPADRIGRLARGVGSTPRSTDRPQRANLTIEFSATATDRAKARDYLSAHRVRLLEEFEEALGGVYVFGGRLFVIRRRDTGKQIDLITLYDVLGMCALMFTESATTGSGVRNSDRVADDRR